MPRLSLCFESTFKCSSLPYIPHSHTSSLLLPPMMEDVRECYTSPTQVAVPSPYQSGTVATSSISQSADHEMRPEGTKDGVPPVELPSSLEEEEPIRDLIC
ncbi:hypothetical protein POM88_034718 [Heracleum sosnowskyi]|uniref:Uncharacterized protein n=1 Tax=Heracleum sosnowskyi TaxID=360622 RepID=A0AAD8MCK4_9APIA|nr:hypothetical protein POM88_034718 [Heracleum sosnowskyi]